MPPRKPAPTDLLLTDLLPHLDATLGQGKGGTAHAPIRLHRGTIQRRLWLPTPKAPPVLGIDPGEHGYLCLLHDGAGPLLVPMPLRKGEFDRPVPDGKRLFALLGEWQTVCCGNLRVVMERPQTHGRNDTAQTSFGVARNGTPILTALEIHEIEPLLVAPGTWQAEMLQDGDPTPAPHLEAAKEAPTRRALELWPQVDWPKGARKGRYKSGASDAALIGEFGRRLLARGEWK